MGEMDGWLGANRANWNERAAIHAARDGSGYQVQAFVEDRLLLSEVVRFDLPVLGDIAGKNAVHLQCHIGTDTISLARLGATVTGLDFSDDAIREARVLAAEAGDAVTFVQADVHDPSKILPRNSFDLAVDLLIRINPDIGADLHAGRRIGTAPHEVPRLQLGVLNHGLTRTTHSRF